MKRYGFHTALAICIIAISTFISSLTCFTVNAVAEDLTGQGATGSELSSRTWYTCGMHPDVIQDHPGDCPICGMKLQPMSPDRARAMGLLQETKSKVAPLKNSGERKVRYYRSPMVPGEVHELPGKDSMGHELIPVYEDEASSGGEIHIDPSITQNMGIRVAPVIQGPVQHSVRTVGVVDYNETTLAVVNTKVDGWVEKLYVDQTGMQVHAGDPLFELYSPELFSGQQEYLAAKRGAARSSLPTDTLVRDARTRLKFFDISEEQIQELEKTGVVKKTLTIRAPFTGIVTLKKVVQGQMVKAGEELFRIADLSTVWVVAKIYERDFPYIKLGQQALMTLSYIAGKTFAGHVTYVYPYLEAENRVMPVRIEFHNPGYELKPGMYATVTLASSLADKATLVPDLAVIQTGSRSVAFVMPEKGRFELRNLILGPRTDDNYYQVLMGLAPGETVVVSGQFLLDSESRLREAALKFLKPKSENLLPSANDSEKTSEPAVHEHGEKAQKLYYVCPMPGHEDVLYDNPGKCPLCGMEMVPILREGEKVEKPSVKYWTCPMSEHRDVREEGPGKCPICGMTLIPKIAEQSDTNSSDKDSHEQ